MPDPAPSPGLPNPADALKAVRMVRAASRSTEGIVAAISLLLAMPRDARYQMSAWCRAGIPLIVATAVLNYLLWNVLLPIPVLAQIVERLVLLALGIGGFVIVSRELSRYRTVLEYIAAYGQPTVTN